MVTPVSGFAQQTPSFSHVFIVLEENHNYSSVIGSKSMPYLNSMANTYGLATQYYANTHPSIGNYFMLTTGQLVTTDDSTTTVESVDNLARRVLAANLSFKVYAEGITQGYLGGNKGLYVIRHNPFALFSDIANSPKVANQVLWPFSQFASDLGKNALPEFSYIVPDLNDDAHNGTPQQADSWLQANVVAPLSGNPAFQPGGDGILIVLFDEASDPDTTHGGGHVVAAFWGPNVKQGFTQTSSTVYQHESMLRAIMESLQLPNPPGAAATAPSMAEFFVQK